MHKMPRIWVMYYEFLKTQKKIKKIRETLDKALQALPVTQHDKIWDEYSKWALEEITYIPLAKYIIERYIKLNPDFLEEYANWLKEKGEHDEYCVKLVKLIDDDSFSSRHGKSKFEFCMELCKEISKNSDKIKSLDGELIVRHCITKYTDEVGNLWVSLADYFIIRGVFDKGRDVFEEALEKVVTARDFGIIYNAYLKFEEELLMVVMEEGDVELTDKVLY
jgi:pre-mRNA-splicing factor SYF1